MARCFRLNPFSSAPQRVPFIVSNPGRTIETRTSRAWCCTARAWCSVSGPIGIAFAKPNSSQSQSMPRRVVESGRITACGIARKRPSRICVPLRLGRAAASAIDHAGRFINRRDAWCPCPIPVGQPSIDLDAATRASFDRLSDAAMSYRNERTTTAIQAEGARQPPPLPQWKSAGGDEPLPLVLDSATDVGVRPNPRDDRESILDEIQLIRGCLDSRPVADSTTRSPISRLAPITGWTA